MSGILPTETAEPVAAAAPRGPLSESVLAAISGDPVAAPGFDHDAVEEALASVEDPLGDEDLQLALYLAYEIHYRSFPGVAEDWEWDPRLIALRSRLERRFWGALRASVPPGENVGTEGVGAELFRLEAEDEAPSLSRFLETRAELEQFREFVVHRSLYQLKEADPHSWAIPRLSGPAKTALLEVQSDEYGGGRPDRMHSFLFAKTMLALDLDTRENHYLDSIPGFTLATVNLMSGAGLSRARRGVIVGHLAMFEMTSAQPNRRYGNAMRRFGFDAEATDFYDEHVEADAVHENIAAYDLAGGLARQEPGLTEDILFGARALLFLEGRFASRLLDAWEAGRSSLLRPL